MTDHQVQTYHRIYNSEMGSIASRLGSFGDWPENLHQKPEDLANCGFYYLGAEDKVVCFHCGVGLKDWLPEDNVWLEHAINSSSCPFLLLNKRKAQIGEQEDSRFKELMVCITNLLTRMKNAFHLNLHLYFRTSFTNLMGSRNLK
jgi:hypothetical protein